MKTSAKEQRVTCCQIYLIKHYFLVLDIDECADEYENDCDPNAVCTNTEGSHICQCYRGFEGDGQNCTGQLKLTFQYFSKVILINFVKIHSLFGKMASKFQCDFAEISSKFRNRAMPIETKLVHTCISRIISFRS